VPSFEDFENSKNYCTYGLRRVILASVLRYLFSYFDVYMAHVIFYMYEIGLKCGVLFL